MASVSNRNRLAEYDYDDIARTTTLLREYVWMNGQAVGVRKGGMLYLVRRYHIGRTELCWLCLAWGTGRDPLISQLLSEIERVRQAVA